MVKLKISLISAIVSKKAILQPLAHHWLEAILYPSDRFNRIDESFPSHLAED